MSIEKSKPTYVRIVRDGGHHIKAWRKHFDLSVHHLSERVSALPPRFGEDQQPRISASMISQLEQGKAGYTQKTLELLAEALKLQPWQLLASEPGENWDFWLVALDHCESKGVWDDIDDADKKVLAVQINNLCEAVVGAVLKSAPVVLRKDFSVSRNGEAATTRVR